MKLYKQFPIIGLNVKLYYFTCLEHFQYLQYDLDQLIALNINLPQSYSHEEQLYEIEHSKFIGYSSLILCICFDCNCKNDVLQQICSSLRNNEEFLMYKTKFIIQNYGFLNNALFTGDTFFTGKPFQKASCQVYKKYSGNLKLLRLVNISQIIQAENDHNTFLEFNISNAVFLQCTVKNLIYLVKSMDIFYQGDKPLQILNSRGWDGIICYTTNIELYIYHINPTLSIIINNNYFDHPSLTAREGSQHDINNLTEQLSISNIPYMLLQDLSREKLLKLIRQLATANFSAFKGLMFVIMTHGNSDGVLYTQDGSTVNIKSNIIQPIQRNATLEDVLKMFLFVACRGDKDPSFLDDEDADEIDEHHTDGSYLQRNSVVLYSVKEHLKSPRYVDSGTPAMKHFCQQFRKSKHNNPIPILAENMHQQLKKDPFFCNLENVMECVVNESNVTKPYESPKVIKSEVNVNNLLEMTTFLNNFQIETDCAENGTESISQALYEELFEFYDNNAPFKNLTTLMKFELLIKKQVNSQNMHRLLLNGDLENAITDNDYVYNLWCNIISDHLALICSWNHEKDPEMEQENLMINTITFDISCLAVTLTLQELCNKIISTNDNRFKEQTKEWLVRAKSKVVQEDTGGVFEI